MSPKGQKRDVNLDCPNIKAFREIIHLQLNYIQRQYVVDKVSCCERGQRLWRSTLTEWMLHGFSPKNIPGMVKLFENQFYSEPGLRFSQWEPNRNGDKI